MKRIMLKISGETLWETWINNDKLKFTAKIITDLQKQWFQIAVVVWAGNIWRYRDNSESVIKRTDSDYMGMLWTIMNAVAIKNAINFDWGNATVCSVIDIPQLAEKYTIEKASKYLDEWKIVFCAGGTGNPYFTTDSWAALRALELNCDVVIKATKVDGIYDCDPTKNPDAKKYDRISFDQVIEEELEVMDQTAFSLCKEWNMDIIITKMDDSIVKALNGDLEICSVSSVISNR